MTVVFNSAIPVVPENGTLSATDPAVAVTTLPNASGANSQVEGNVASGAADSGNPVKVGGVYNVTPPTLTTGQRGDLQLDSSGATRAVLMRGNTNTTVNVSANLAADAVSTSIPSLAVQGFGYKFNGTTWDRDRKANTVGRLPSSAASVNATLVKGSAGGVFFISGNNANAAIRYLKLYNKATAPTVGTDTPFMTFALKPLEPFNIPFGGEIFFSLGIGYGLTTGAADADVGAVAAGDILGLNIAYI